MQWLPWKNVLQNRFRKMTKTHFMWSTTKINDIEKNEGRTHDDCESTQWLRKMGTLM